MSTIHAPIDTFDVVAEGWYADPTGGHRARWWDGTEWTSHVQALPMGAPPEEDWVEGSRLVPSGASWSTRALTWGIAAVVANVLMAPTVMAFVFGVMAVRRRRRLISLGYEVESPRRAVVGIALGAVGILLAIFWIVVLRVVTHPAA